MVTNNAKNEPTAASGKVLQGQGIGTASNFSTATYPSVATGTGKILRADGTNWSPTTATYPDLAGTSTNVLTSDGTNWVSSAAAAGTALYGFIDSNNTAASMAANNTYYFGPNQTPQLGPSTPPTYYRFYAPIAFTMNSIALNFFAFSGGTNENATLFVRKNDTTNTNISTTIQITSTSNPYSFSSLGISFSAGDFFWFGLNTPVTWATAPIQVSLSLAFST